MRSSVKSSLSNAAWIFFSRMETMRRRYPWAPTIRRTSEPAAGYQLRGDHVALDLVGALTDDHQRGIAEIPLDVVFGGIPVAAVDAHGVERDLHRHLRGEQLGHPGLHVAALAAVVTLGGITGQLAGCGQLGRHVGQIVTDRLVLPNRLTEALALLRVGQRVI